MRAQRADITRGTRRVNKLVLATEFQPKFGLPLGIGRLMKDYVVDCHSKCERSCELMM
jgi:hypothetical protein